MCELDGRSESNAMYYRIVEFLQEDGITLWAHTYNVVKQTPKGVWIYDQYCLRRRFVLNSARKRYALPTIKEAKESYRERKLCQIAILDRQLNTAKTCLDYIQDTDKNARVFFFTDE